MVPVGLISTRLSEGLLVVLFRYLGTDFHGHEDHKHALILAEVIMLNFPFHFCRPLVTAAV